VRSVSGEFGFDVDSQCAAKSPTGLKAVSHLQCQTHIFIPAECDDLDELIRILAVQCAYYQLKSAKLPMSESEVLNSEPINHEQAKWPADSLVVQSLGVLEQALSALVPRCEAPAVIQS
jgi:hypothetical protein